MKVINSSKSQHFSCIMHVSRPGNRCRARVFKIFKHTVTGGGKSELRRTRCQVTPGGRKPMTSATESKPPLCGKGEMAR